MAQREAENKKERRRKMNITVVKVDRGEVGRRKSRSKAVYRSIFASLPNYGQRSIFPPDTHTHTHTYIHTHAPLCEVKPTSGTLLQQKKR